MAPLTEKIQNTVTNSIDGLINALFAGHLVILRWVGQEAHLHQHRWGVGIQCHPIVGKFGAPIGSAGGGGHIG